MKVAMVCDWFLKYVDGLASALVAADNKVLLVCREHSLEFAGISNERERIVERLVSSGVEVVTIRGRLSAPIGMIDAASARRRLERWQPDVIHAQENHDPRLLMLSPKRPLVVTVHDPTPHPGAPPHRMLSRVVRKQWLRKATRVIVHGEELAHEMSRLVAGDRIAVVEHGTVTRSEPLPVPIQRRIVLFGRLETYKGLSVLGQAMRIVWEAQPDVRLAVFGRGPAASELPEDGRVEVHAGYFPEANIGGILRDSTLVALPYIQASQSGVGVLAIGSGVPAVVSRVGSLPALASRPSLVVPPNDPMALAQALLFHIDHDGALRREVLDHAQSQFSWAAAALRTATVYEDARGSERR
jgi:glycosyltransferase involved in cell wall biosynthesis